ncbi:Uncharacterised protein [Vibrio cholerae]|uniref:Uncharacterized protein n=1 Tax=Vibrio cholerae TaxID=666 RepID=A0A655Z2B4_VIBCL|nr:Uncharacterised protein [Vibrio cholerae]
MLQLLHKLIEMAMNTFPVQLGTKNRCPLTDPNRIQTALPRQFLIQKDLKLFTQIAKQLIAYRITVLLIDLIEVGHFQGD